MRRLLLSAVAVLFSLFLGLALPRPCARAQNPQLTQRLILKDGSYQPATKWEIHGDRVRYYSAERYQWEEVPYSLVDWPATEQWEKESASHRISEETKEVSAELEEAKREEEARTPLVAPGIKLPSQGGVFLLDRFQGQPQLVELTQSGGRALTQRYQGLLDHYGLKSTRIFPRKAHENGVVEQAHRRTKSILAQMLVLRGSREFTSVEEYQAWVREVIEREHNALLGEKLAEERRHLHALPALALPAYTGFTVTVRRWSTIRVVNHAYSVAARLIGERVRVHLHHDHLEVYYAGKLVERLPRLRGQRWARIDYHHVIWSLVKKPGAFARYRWREELFPSLVFRRAYDALRSFQGERADAQYVRILYLAAVSGEAVVERTLAELLDGGERFDADRVRHAVRPERPSVPAVAIGAPDLKIYDALLSEAAS